MSVPFVRLPTAKPPPPSYVPPVRFRLGPLSPRGRCSGSEGAPLDPVRTPAAQTALLDSTVRVQNWDRAFTDSKGVVRSPAPDTNRTPHPRAAGEGLGAERAGLRGGVRRGRLDVRRAGRVGRGGRGVVGGRAPRGRWTGRGTARDPGRGWVRHGEEQSKRGPPVPTRPRSAGGHPFGSPPPTRGVPG